jgi:DNA-binding NarL/FixJ family response regulator
MGAEPIRVLIADDQALVRDGFRLILDVEPSVEVIGEAADGAVAVEQTIAQRPDVVLMDVRMPRVDGLTATERIVAAGVPSRILILTTYDEDGYLYRAVRSGASGFLLKDTRREGLVHAIHTVAAGDALLHPALTRRLLDRFCHGPAPGERPAAVASLTDRELEVLREVARGRSNAEIATALHLSTATVKTHLAHLTAKLGLRDRIQAVVLAYECGLVRPGNPSA